MFSKEAMCTTTVLLSHSIRRWNSLKPLYRECIAYPSKFQNQFYLHRFWDTKSQSSLFNAILSKTGLSTFSCSNQFLKRERSSDFFRVINQREMHNNAKQFLHDPPEIGKEHHNIEVGRSLGCNQNDESQLKVVQASSSSNDNVKRVSSVLPLEPLLVIIDLDETLLFSHLNRDSPHDFSVNVDKQEIFVSLRPGCSEFLKWCSERFETGMSTAGTASYAQALLKVIDPNETMIPISNHRYRSSCWPVTYEMRFNDKSILQTLYAKDLLSFRKDLSRIVLIDNSLFSFALQPDNGIPVPDWRGHVENAQQQTINTHPQSGIKAQEPKTFTATSTMSDDTIYRDNSQIFSNSSSNQETLSNTPSSYERSQEIVKDNEQEKEYFKDFYSMKKVLEELENVNDVRPVLRNRYRLVDTIIRKCISGMMVQNRA